MTIIQVTKNAWTKLAHIMKKSGNTYGFLFSAESGGCNGFNFNLGLLSQTRYLELENTKFISKVEENNTTIYIDPLTEMYLMGTKIDYMKEDISNNMYESKFVYSIDKSLASTCGCGTSFTRKDI